MMTSLHLALTIAGSDTCGGAGMQADLKTFEELRVYDIIALTCIVAMDFLTWKRNVKKVLA